MSDPNAAIAALKHSIDELTAALERASSTLADRSAPAKIDKLTKGIERLTLVLEAVRQKMDIETNNQFRALLQRPTVAPDRRNTRPDAPGDE